MVLLSTCANFLTQDFRTFRLMRSISLFSSIDDIDAAHGEEAGDEVLRVEGFAQAEAGGEGAYYGYEGVEDGHLAYGIATDELVVEGKAEG